MDGEWFKWILGMLSAFYGAAIGWIIKTITDHHKEVRLLTRLHADDLHQMDLRVVKLETRPYIDALAYTKVITELTIAVAALTKQIADNNHSREEQYREVMASMITFQQQMDSLIEQTEKNNAQTAGPGRAR